MQKLFEMSVKQPIAKHTLIEKHNTVTSNPVNRRNAVRRTESTKVFPSLDKDKTTICILGKKEQTALPLKFMQLENSE